MATIDEVREYHTLSLHALRTTVFSGDLTAITTVRTTLGQTSADLADDPAYRCGDRLPGHRHLLGNGRNPPPVFADCADFSGGSQQ